MSYFQHNSDNFISMRVGDTSYVAPLSDFIVDLGDPTHPYRLELPYCSRYYEPGVTHYCMRTADPTKYEKDMPWPEGDAYLAELPNLVAALTARKSSHLVVQQGDSTVASPTVNPMAKYNSALYALQGSGLLDRLLTTSDTAALASLMINGTVLFDDSRIAATIRAVVAGLREPLTDDELARLQVILGKAGITL